MYIRIGDRIINAAVITDIEITELEGEPLLKIHFGSDRLVKLSGEEAEVFLGSLPTYSPVSEEEV
jgi:hypothetical protein